MTVLSIAQYRIDGGRPWHDDLPDHLSPTQLAMFQRCPRQYQQRYLFGRRERPAEAPVVGSAVHRALEINYEQKIDSHADMPTASLLDWYSDVGFASVLDEQQERSGSEIIWDTDHEQARTRGRVMLGEYHNLVSPRIQPVSVEGSFSIDMGLPVPMQGRYDVLEATRCIDFKTGKRKQSKPKEEWRLQGAIYTQATGRPVEFHSISATVNNAVSIVTPLESEEMLVHLSARELEVVRANVEFIAAKITLCMERYGHELPWPPTGRFHDWACGYCGFRNDCPAWESER